MYFRVSVLHFMKVSVGLFIEMLKLNLYINLRRLDIFMIWTLSFNVHGISLHLFKSSMCFSAVSNPFP